MPSLSSFLKCPWLYLDFLRWALESSFTLVCPPSLRGKKNKSSLGAYVVAQWVKPLASLINMLVWVLPTVCPSFHLLINTPGKVADDGLNGWSPVTHLGNPNGVPGSRVSSGSALAAEATWGVNRRAEHMCLSLLLPPQLYFQVK